MTVAEALRAGGLKKVFRSENPGTFFNRSGNPHEQRKIQMPKSRDGPESWVCEVFSLRTFFNWLSKSRAVTSVLKGAVERPPR